MFHQVSEAVTIWPFILGINPTQKKKITQVLDTYFIDSVNYFNGATEHTLSTTDEPLTILLYQMDTLAQDFISVNIHLYLPQAVSHSNEMVIILPLSDTPV
jgi:hypothetical protein